MTIICSPWEAFIAKLASKGYAYKGDDNSIYFNIKKFEDYGKLSKIEFKELKDDKRNKELMS